MPELYCPFCGSAKVEPILRAEDSLAELDSFHVRPAPNRWCSSPELFLMFRTVSPETLVYAGKVGTGFTDAMLNDLDADLKRLVTTTSPFLDVPRSDARDAQWVAPLLVGEVAFAESTDDGRLRHPAWRGLRPDKSPDEVVRES